MTTYLVRRIVYALLTFLGITVATFTLIHSVPGDPITFYIGHAGPQTIPPAVIAQIKHEFYLDRPLGIQYLHWMRGAATLDFGRSIVDRRPVREVILEKLPNTFELNFAAFFIAALIGVPVVSSF